MRHGKKINHLGRTAPHRKAMLSNMATSLILNKRISTTVAKAKALRKYVEPLITKAKNDTTHSRRIVFSYLQDKNSINELFGEVAEKITDRPGGYTRIIKTGSRLGDNAEMCIMELVDYNELLITESKPSKSKRRRGGKKKSGENSAEVEAKNEEIVEEKVEDATEQGTVETAEAPVAETTEEEAQNDTATAEETPEASDDSKTEEGNEGEDEKK